MLARCIVAATLLGALVIPARADERPSTGKLVGAGAGFAVPTYFLGVAIHEGTHALTAKLVGADVREVHLLPGVRHGKFYFGYVRVRDLRSVRNKSLFYLAPKLVDMVMLGGYSALWATDSLPDNHYGALGLTVLATGFWVDFSKDLPAFWDHSDIVKLYNLQGWTTESRRMPARLLHLGLSAMAGYVIWQGYRDVFDDPDPTQAARIVPLWVGAF